MGQTSRFCACACLKKLVAKVPGRNHDLAYYSNKCISVQRPTEGFAPDLLVDPGAAGGKRARIVFCYTSEIDFYNRSISIAVNESAFDVAILGWRESCRGCITDGLLKAILCKAVPLAALFLRAQSVAVVMLGVIIARVWSV